MTDDILKSIHEELVAIRKLLADRPAAPAASRPASSYSGSSSGENAEIPQPSQIVADAGDVQVHFGKNNGVPLSQLAERSLSWYATEQAPRLDSSGKPYPPRPQEIVLRNAARTLWHQRKGTLKGEAREESRTPPPESRAGAGAASNEEVPFARFEPLFP